MIDREHELTVSRQAALLQLSRSSLYYEPRPVSPNVLALMRRIDELHLNYPFAGRRMLRDMLRADGVIVGRELVTRLMRQMGIEAIYRRPNTSKPAAGNKIYPYLLRNNETNARIDSVAAGSGYVRRLNLRRADYAERNGCSADAGRDGGARCVRSLDAWSGRCVVVGGVGRAGFELAAHRGD